MTEPTPEPTITGLLDKVLQSTRDVVQFMRRRFLWTWLAISLLALLTCISLILATRNASTNLEQTDDIARVANTTAQEADKSADQASQDTDQIVAYMQGDQGIPGVPGANGEDGTPGLPGSSGEPGPVGPRGPQGEAGQPGQAGDSGSQGSAGAAGLKGDTGAAGANGAAGARGDQGETGSTGKQGANGQDGANGKDGAPGTPGTPGHTGEAGPQGPPGPPTTFQTIFTTGPSNTATPKSQNATCPSGQRVVGGGFSLDPPTGVRVTVSLPLGTAVWNVQAEQDGLATAWSLTSWAICASATGAT